VATTIRCNKCGNEIEITEALSKELETKVLQEIQSKHEDEMKKLKDRELELLESNKKFEQTKLAELEKLKQEISEQARRDAIEKVRKDYDSRITTTKEEAEEARKQNSELQKQLSEIMKQLRDAKDAENKLKLQFEKQLLEEQDNIKQKARKESDEANALKLAERDKKLSDAEKVIEELQRKVQQGSQQLQGEVQELALEDQLKKEFIYDEIQEVPKGITGADVIQIVRNNSGIPCGTIVWESKNTKAWSQQWISKLKEDTRKLKADISILVSSVLPEGINGFGQIDGVWVCNIKSAIPLTYALRTQIISIRNIQEATNGKATKAEVVYNYLISNEFKQRIEVWIEYFRNRKDELDKEKGYFLKKWEKEEKGIMKVFQNTAGMYGDLQGLIGTALPKVQYLELPEEAGVEKTDKKMTDNLGEDANSQKSLF